MSAVNTISTPNLKIDGKLIKPKSTTMKAWRRFLEFYERDDEDLQSITLSEYTDELVDLIVIGFNRDEVTAEKIEETLGVSQLKPLAQEIYRWLQSVFFLGLEELPNAETGTETQT